MTHSLLTLRRVLTYGGLAEDVLLLLCGDEAEHVPEGEHLDEEPVQGGRGVLARPALLRHVRRVGRVGQGDLATEGEVEDRCHDSELDQHQRTWKWGGGGGTTKSESRKHK
jgi:hypothetical protein